MLLPHSSHNAQGNQGDQGLSPDGTPKGRQVSEDKEEQGQCDQVQGPMQPIPLHPCDQ